MKTRFVAVSGLVILFWGMVLCGGEATPAPAVSGRNSERSPMNPYNGMQTREEVYEFTQKPEVRIQKSEGGAQSWIITFTSKGNCDATVAVVDKDGRIVRHLASGVLGRNAPWPFQQNALAQKIEWDGQDDMGRVVAEDVLKGCRAKVGLGLKPEFEANIGYDPYDIPAPAALGNGATGYLVGKGPNDERYVLGVAPGKGIVLHGCVYTKDGKYVRTFWPPAAKDLEKLAQFGFKLDKTVWGDSVVETPRNGLVGYKSKDAPTWKTLEDAGQAPFGVAGIAEYKPSPRPEWLPQPTLPADFSTFYDRGLSHRMAADRTREEFYVISSGHKTGRSGSSLMRIDGRTGQRDQTWFPNNNLPVTEVCVGPEDHVYIGVGSMGYFQFIVRLDHEGKVVQFGGDAVPIPKKKWESSDGQFGSLEGQGAGWDVCARALQNVEVKALWTGLYSHSNVHDRGLYVSPIGGIVAAIQGPSAERAIKYGAPKERLHKDSRVPGGAMDISYVAVWNKDGKFLTANAVGDMSNGHGVTMDRDGNIYAVLAGVLPAGEKTLVGLADPVPEGAWGGYGSILKFRGGVPFPRAKSYYKKQGSPALPADGIKLKGPGAVSGVKPEGDSLLWAYPGVVCQDGMASCTCHNIRYDMDYFARHWIPANYLGSVMVLDANANIMARVGRYGNVDDADPACGKIHFVWPKALCVSDTALYVSDPTSRRILKASLKYAAEETVPLP